jgi:multiple sugar transport system permease protein
MTETDERLPPVPPVVAAEQFAEEGETAFGAPPPDVPGQGTAKRIRTIVVYALLFLIAILFFIPFFWEFSTSLKTLPESVGFKLWPDNPSFHAYHNALSTFNFKRYLANSFIYAGVITATNLFLASLGGYAFARLRFPGREVLFFLVLGTLMIPNELRLVPVFQMLTDFPLIHVSLIGTREGYFIINLVAATSLFLMRQYFLTIPKDYEEAAKLDGAGYFKTYWRVMLPLAGPALAAVTILTFQGIWNDFFWPLIIFLGSSDLYPLPLGMFQFRTQYQTQWPELMAATVIAIVPITIIYIFFQRYFVAGVTAAGVKG